MDSLTDSHRVERLEVVDTGRRRRFSTAEKIRIVEESYAGPRLASATARRHGIAVPLIFAWRKAYREGRLGDAAPVSFFPVAVSEDDRYGQEVDAGHGPERPAGRIEIELGNGRRVVVGSDVDTTALARVLAVVDA